MNLVYLFAAMGVIVVVLWIGTAIYLRIKGKITTFPLFSKFSLEKANCSPSNRGVA